MKYNPNCFNSLAFQIKHDDYEIEREGLENLTEDELRQACRARGMRAPFGEGAVAFMRRWGRVGEQSTGVTVERDEVVGR